MSYSVYAKLPDGRTIKYGRKLNSVTEVNAAMNEMKKDLKDAGITAKVGYKNDNPPAPSRSTAGKSQPKAAPKIPAKKTSKPDPLDAKLLDLMKERYDKEPTGYHAHDFGRHITLSKNREAMKIVRPSVTLGQVIDSINKRGDTFKLITGRSITRPSEDDEQIVSMTCAIVGKKLGLRSYKVEDIWDPYGIRKRYGYADKGEQLAKKNRPTGSLPPVGTVFYASWGYDQTNVNFYIVDQTRGNTMVHIIPIYGSYVERNGPYGDKVVADKNSIRPFDVLIGKERGDPPTKGKWCKYNPERKSIYLGHEYAWVYDGKPLYQTDPMFGH